MKLRCLAALFNLAALAWAAEPCADVPLCARLAKPQQVFFLGEAVAERQRDGHQPEYRFTVREVLHGLEPDTEAVVVETGEGAPPSGALLIQARRAEDGRLIRTDCELAEPEDAAGAMLAELRTLRTRDASLAVKVRDRGGRRPANLRILLEGAASRLADRDAHFAGLAAGHYRVTAEALGYESQARETEVAPGGCPVIDIILNGTAEIAGSVDENTTITAIDAGTQAVMSSAAVGEDGRYRLTGLPAGKYVLTAGPSFYPGFPHRADATVVELGPGQRVEINFWNVKRK